MAREITQGRITRYVQRAQSLYGATKYFEWAATRPPFLGRRAMLKELRDFMSYSRQQMRRRAARTRAKIVLAWLDDPHQGGRP